MTQQIIEFPLYVANKAVKTTQWLEVQNKYSGEVYEKVALADDKVLEKAIGAAVKAEKDMAALKPYKKKKILLMELVLLQKNMEKLLCWRMI